MHSVKVTGIGSPVRFAQEPNSQRVRHDQSRQPAYPVDALNSLDAWVPPGTLSIFPNNTFRSRVHFSRTFHNRSGDTNYPYCTRIPQNQTPEKQLSEGNHHGVYRKVTVKAKRLRVSPIDDTLKPFPPALLPTTLEEHSTIISVNFLVPAASCFKGQRYRPTPLQWGSSE